MLAEAEEALVVAFRRHTQLPLDDCLYALQPSIPHLTRSALHRCLQRLFVASGRTTKFAITQLVETADRRTAWGFLEHVRQVDPEFAM